MAFPSATSRALADVKDAVAGDVDVERDAEGLRSAHRLTLDPSPGSRHAEQPTNRDAQTQQNGFTRW